MGDVNRAVLVAAAVAALGSPKANESTSAFSIDALMAFAGSFFASVPLPLRSQSSPSVLALSGLLCSRRKRKAARAASPEALSCLFETRG